MSVPPPSWVRMSSSTGSSTLEVRSTTSVSKTTRCDFTPGSPQRTDAVTAEWMTEPTIDPDWSTTRITCHRSISRRCRDTKYGVWTRTRCSSGE